MTTDPLARLVHTLRDTLDTDAESDAALLTRLRAGRNPAAAEAIVRRHGPRVLAACRKVLGPDAEAEDVFQATFLVLLRNPSAVRRKASLGAWLYGVAHRISLQARARRARRARQTSPEVPAAPDLPWREACAVLHEELDRLPESTRLPLVLCYLDGLSRDEAAHQLGRTMNSVKKSLEKGREQLRKRLSKRGVTLSTGLLSAVAEPAVAEPPHDLTRAAVDGWERPSAAVAALARAVGTNLRLRVAGIGLAATVLAVSMALGMPGNPKPEPTQKDEKPASPAAKKDRPGEEGKERIAFSGRVVDPEGKAVHGARLFQVDYHQREDDPPALEPAAVSAADGRFHFAIDRPPKGRIFLRTLVAAAEGFGLGLLPVKEAGAPETEVRLFPDLPVRGRVLNLEGRPVAGATVRVTDVGSQPTPDLADWLKEAEEPGLKLAFQSIFDKLPQRAHLRFRSIPALGPAVTDRVGKFTLPGIGRERVAALTIAAPGMATSQIIVVTRPGPAGQFKLVAGGETIRRPYYRVPFDYVVTPEQPVEGRIADHDTGAPIAGVRLWSMSIGAGDLIAVSDADGRFRIRGMPPGLFRVNLTPGPDAPYHERTVIGGKKDSIQPVRLDVQLRRAPWITGKVIDERTKEPIAGAHVLYKAAKGNTRAADYFDPGRSVEVQVRTGADGSFRLAGIPGEGWLFIYRETPGLSAAERPVQGDTDRTEPPAEVQTSDQSSAVISPRIYQALVAVDINPRSPREYTITLDPGVTVPVTLTDPENKPLTGVISLGVNYPWFQWSKPLTSEKFNVPAFNPDNPRALVFYHPDRELGLLLQPKKGDSGPWTIKLLPTATVIGRLVLPDGKPYPNADLTLSFTYPGERAPAWLPDHSAQARFKTDADGRFQFTKVMGDVDYVFWYKVLGDKSNTTTTIPFRAKPGETKDLGTIKTDPPRK